jgi:hypothetical protein
MPNDWLSVSPHFLTMKDILSHASAEYIWLV